MRLLEITSAPEVAPPAGTLTTLLNYLRSKAKQNPQSKINVRVPTSILLKLMRNAGIGDSYDDLDTMYKSDQTIKNLIKTYDQEHVVLRTNAEDDDLGKAFEPGDETDVASMAKRAASKRD
jgi:hypothetical protein